MAKEKVCPLHGSHERRKCPACVWCETYPNHVAYKSGCPRCGRELHSNGHIMSCGNNDCLMQTTNHPPLTGQRRRVKPSAVGLRGSRV
jgi:hypothetical protein